jgi:heterodisulfide reductase subunit D
MTNEDPWKEFGLMERIQLYACGKCGECIKVCPVYEMSNELKSAPAFRIRALKSLFKKKYGLRSLIFGSRKIDPKEIQKLVDPMYHGCTVCGHCMVVCPFNFDLIEIWEKAREFIVNSGFGPAPTVQVKEAVESERNVYKMPHAARLEWLEYEEVEAPKNEKADILYFVGCTTSYSGILMPIAHAVTTILDAAGEDWTLLKDEWCCGSPLKFAGQTEKFHDFVMKNIKDIEATGARLVVFSCPACYRRFKQEYHKVLGKPLSFELKHIVELVNDYIKEGKLKPFEKLDETITYHDPCELSRLLGLYDEPREILNAFTTNVVELPENKDNGFCCGAGGLLKAIDADLSLSLSKKRIEQAEAVKATILASACPACKLNLDEAAFQKESNITVMDITELIVQQLDL